MNMQGPDPTLPRDAGTILNRVYDTTVGALRILGAGGSLPATTPTVYNITMTLANTEYGQALPAATKKFEFRCRGAFDIRYSYETGRVATPTAPYRTLASGITEYQTDLNLTGVTLYVACGNAAQVVELEVWT